MTCRSGGGTLSSANTTPDRNMTTVNTCSITKRMSGTSGTSAATTKPAPAANRNTAANSNGSAK